METNIHTCRRGVSEILGKEIIGMMSKKCLVDVHYISRRKQHTDSVIIDLNTNKITIKMTKSAICKLLFQGFTIPICIVIQTLIHQFGEGITSLLGGKGEPI